MGRSLLSIILSVFLWVTVAANPANSVRRFEVGEGTCNAWPSSTDRWVTAGHCAKEVQATIGGFPATLMKVNKVRDMALYSTGPEATPVRILTLGADPAVGDHVRTLAYVFTTREPMTFFGRVTSGNAPELTGRLLIHGDFTIMGTSGAPVVNDQGHVVGMMKGGLDMLPVISLAVSVQDLREFLK